MKDSYEIAMDVLYGRLDKCNEELKRYQERLKKGFKGTMSCENTLLRMQKCANEHSVLTSVILEIMDRVEKEESE